VQNGTMINLKWALIGESTCCDGNVHEYTIHESPRCFTTFTECRANFWDYQADYANFSQNPTPVFFRFYSQEFPVSKESEFVDLTQFRDSYNYDEALQEEDDDEDNELAQCVWQLQLEEMENTKFLWRLYEKFTCGHEVQVERSNDIFTSLYDCLLDFNLNAKYDFSASCSNNDFSLRVEAI